MTGKIVLGDAIDMLKSLPDGCAELVIADPPYSIEKDREFGAGAFFDSREEWLSWCRKWLFEAKRVLSPTGNLFVYGIHDNACFLQVELYALEMQYRRQIIWHYENGWSKYTRAPSCEYEPILWFSKATNSTYHTIREPYKSVERLRHPIKKNGKIWIPNPDGKRTGDVWKFPTLAGRRFAAERTSHPTQKPLALCDRLVQHFSNEGDLVVVPFVGSGSECEAASNNARRYIGAEINPEFVRIARARLENAALRKSVAEPGLAETVQMEA